MRPFIFPILLLAACSSEDVTESPGTKPDRAAAGIVDLSTRDKGPEPEYVTVDHILIGVRSADMPKGLPQKEAAALVETILDELASGGSWFDLKQKHSNDPGSKDVRGGPYAMSNNNALRRADVTPRGKMVNAFGDIGFRLEVGEIAVAPYKVARGPGWSPFGYHIIKRVK